MSRTCTCDPLIENLEPRTLMSGTPLSITTVVNQAGVTLVISGSRGNDQITVKQTAGGILVGNTGGWYHNVAGTINHLWINGSAGNNSIVLDASVTLDATVYGGGVNSTVVAGSGNDTLFGGTGKTVLQAGSGNDVLVSFGSTAATLIGGSGADSFWTDNTPAQKVQRVTAAETRAGAVHRVGGFINAGGIASVGKNIYNARSRVSAVRDGGIREPAVDPGVSYASFSDDPIFPAGGPSPNDVFQGNIGDCYYLSVLSSVAKVDPARIRDSILDMGDGTVLVALNKNGKPVFVREDEKLPVNADGTLAYAGLGQNNCTWAALMEKAFCYTRSSQTSYAAIDSGWMDEAYEAIGVTPTSTSAVSSAASLATLIGADLASGQSVTYGTNDTPDTPLLVADHAYMLDSATLDSRGNVLSITLRNPWGSDANGNGDGYVTLTAAQAFASFTGLVSAKV